jgi:hypothetical protein
MKEYQKIETIYERSMDGNKKLIEGQWRNPIVAYLKNMPWVWVEKIDGTNIRVQWDGHTFNFAGRTDKAEIPKLLLARLQEIFLNDKMEQMFEQLFGETEVIVFGEGYGVKIQKCGGDYLQDRNDFRVFDIMVNDTYLDLSDVVDICNKLGLHMVHMISTGTLLEAVEFIKQKPISTHGKCIMEGLVCRPWVRIYDHQGKRIIVKIKVKDFEEDVRDN